MQDFIQNIQPGDVMAGRTGREVVTKVHPRTTTTIIETRDALGRSDWYDGDALAGFVVYHDTVDFPGAWRPIRAAVEEFSNN